MIRRRRTKAPLTARQPLSAQIPHKQNAALTICRSEPHFPSQNRGWSRDRNKPLWGAAKTKTGWKTGAFMKISTSFAAISLASLLCTGASLAQQQAPAGLTEGMDPAIARRMAIPPADPVTFNIPPATNEWLTWGYDQERTGWNRAETALSPKTVGKLKQLWSTQLSVPVDKYVLSTMTAPIVAAGVSTPSGAKD